MQGAQGQFSVVLLGPPEFFFRDKQCCITVRHWDDLYHDAAVSEIMVGAPAQIHVLNVFVGL